MWPIVLTLEIATKKAYWQRKTSLLQAQSPLFEGDYTENWIVSGHLKRLHKFSVPVTKSIELWYQNYVFRYFQTDFKGGGRNGWYRFQCEADAIIIHYPGSSVMPLEQ
jgi:hypothetical protein